jgi:uncharacterized protein YbjQ (UPF0145 family)
MLITTTHTVEGRKIARYIGIVSGESVIRPELIKDFLSDVLEVHKGGTKLYRHTLRQARDGAIGQMTSQAQEFGANGIVGVSVDCEVLGQNEGTLLMVTCTGTAVILE